MVDIKTEITPHFLCHHLKSQSCYRHLKKMFKRARHCLSSHLTPLFPPNPDHSFIRRLEKVDVNRCLTVLILDSRFDEKMILHAGYLTVILLLIILVIILSVIVWKRRSRPGTLIKY